MPVSAAGSPATFGVYQTSYKGSLVLTVQGDAAAERTLRVHVGVWNSAATLQALASDGSAYVGSGLRGGGGCREKSKGYGKNNTLKGSVFSFDHPFSILVWCWLLLLFHSLFFLIFVSLNRYILLFFSLSLF